MTRYWRNIVFAYLLAFAAAAAVVFFAHLLRQSPQSAYELSKIWELSFQERSLGEFRPPFYKTGNSRSEFPRGVYTARVRFSLEKDYRQPVLVLPRLYGNALRVKLNGTLIGTVGDMQRGRTNRWNASHLFSLPSHSLSDINTLELQLYGLYEMGLGAPPYIAEREKAAGHFMLLSQLNNRVISYAIGSLLLLALLFLLTARAIERGKRERVFIAIALLGLAVYLMDYLLIETLPVPYHVHKRIALFGLYLSLVVSIPGFYGYTHKRLNPPAYAAMVLPVAAGVAIAFVPRNIFDVLNIYTYANFSFIPLIIVLHTALLPRLKRDRRALWILIGLTVLSLLALRDVVGVFVESGLPILTHYGIILLEIALSFALIGEMLEYYSRMVSLKQWADTVYHESMRDPLTGALNRKILDNLKQINQESFSLILLDLDDFKPINDTYGHRAGDTVLKVLVETIVINIRKTDYVIRLGGDEFGVILFSCDLPTAEKTAELLHTRLSERRIMHSSGEIRIQCSMGVGEVASVQELDQRIEEIDRLLYYAKRTGKGHVVSDRKSELARQLFSG